MENIDRDAGLTPKRTASAAEKETTIQLKLAKGAKRNRRSAIFLHIDRCGVPRILRQ